jgi:hypothetical protein
MSSLFEMKALTLVCMLVTTSSASSLELSRIYHEINSQYDVRHPLPHNYSLAHQLKSHVFRKRCIYIDPSSAIQSWVSGQWTSSSYGLNVLVHSPCLGSDSMGNYLGSYFETIACADLAGLHYLSVAKVYEANLNHTQTAFTANLPNYIENRIPVSADQVGESLKKYCPCANSCHEHASSAWVSRLHVIRSIFIQALLGHLSHSSTVRNTVVNENDIATEVEGSVLPLIPDVAIHYRCGDNFVGDYGFLPFSAIKGKIPESTSLIYVLAENRGRKTSGVNHLRMKCDAILSSLGNYLKLHFPLAKIVVKRGDDLYIDMARLAFANTTICSVSTFCLWPAIANNGTAYFPLSKLVVGGDKSISLGFQWLLQPEVVLGAEHARKTAKSLVEILGGSWVDPALRTLKL